MRVSKPIIGVFATFLFVLLSMQSFAQGTSGPADVTGEVAVEIADFFEEGRSETYYFIVDKQSNARTQVFFPGSPDEAFTSGARVRIQGTSRGKNRSIPGTWFTLYTGDIVNTLSGPKGLRAGSTRPFSLSKNPRS